MRLSRTLSMTLLLVLMVALLPASANTLNVLMYHHVANDTPPATSTRVDVFRDHLDYLDENHEVVDLVWALERLQAGESIPDNAVALTFDDAYINVYDTAWPMMQEYDFPFTVFVATQPVDQGSRIVIQWDQLREMHEEGVRLLNHSHGHEYMVRYDAYDDTWREEVIETVETAQRRLTEELGEEPPKIFAYPYGEYNDLLRDIMEDLGYISMGQHSGGIADFSDWQALPRFAAGGTAANLDTLKVKLQSRPLPVEFPLPEQVTNDRRPVLEARLLDNDDVRWDALNCFTGAGTPIPFSIDGGVLTAQTEEDFRDGRNRYNCTAPARSGGFYWLSRQWLVNQGPADY
ncbi:MAG: polysaccharide deacetylase family protein [Natronospirillum sp.]|uniref:polysaccharide deacetylase family protein n=1 Tax=Natronospirillum sp. TaxID=2812955 RepID=UPI0025DDB60A|nr:polysaccharide deacetylase family protein [Natronospirillum sp.]MCH8551959.1 polysaccharide deacetylase family protein [Natronospirillum sp.]